MEKILEQDMLFRLTPPEEFVPDKNQKLQQNRAILPM